VSPLISPAHRPDLVRDSRDTRASSRVTVPLIPVNLDDVVIPVDDVEMAVDEEDMPENGEEVTETGP